jgi:group I intron endonuclease
VEIIEDKSWVVYIHRSPSNKAYIGITCQKPENRWKSGNGYLRKNKNGEYKQPLIANAINKYGWDNFEHIIWAENLTQKQACTIEKTLISLFETNCNKYGYNVRDGGDASRLSEETRRKLSKIKQGHIVSEETRKKISESKIGTVPSEEVRQKWSKIRTGELNPMSNKHHSEETKIKISEANKGNLGPNKGKRFSKETRQKISEAKKGQRHSDETRKKISQATAGSNNPNYGKHHSEEVRKKIGEANKGKLAGSNSHQAKSIIRLSDKKIYGCIKDAAIDNSVCRNTMVSYCQKQKNFMFYSEYICTQEVTV